MSEKTLREIKQTIEAKLIVELELAEQADNFVMVQVNTGRSFHQFMLSREEDVADWVICYIDAFSTLRGEAEAIEALWNQLAFEHRLITDFVYGWPEGLQVYADFGGFCIFPRKGIFEKI